MNNPDGTGANDDEREGEQTVGSPHAGEQAGDPSSRENEARGLEEPNNDGDDPDGDDPDGDDDEHSDETGDEHGPAVARARKQAARYRRELRETEGELERARGELWIARVEALGLLADPEDLPFDAQALDDPDRLRELADELLSRKPHLRSTRIRQRAGQGEGTGDDGFSLAGLLKRGA